MIRVRRIYDISSYLNEEKLAAVVGIYEKAFPYHPNYASKISNLIKNQSKKNFEIILLAAEGIKSRIVGFSLIFYFPDLKMGYLDYLASDPKRKSRGIGAALYEASQDLLLNKKCHGLLMDVPPDDKALLKDTSNLDINKRRLKFYESYGARPISGTIYEHYDTKANAGYYTYLVFDPLKRKAALRKKDLKAALARILGVKADMQSSHPKLTKILESIKDDPVKLREPLYIKQELISQKEKNKLVTIDVVTVDGSHKIHHLTERGYVERPARVDAIMKGIGELPIDYHKSKRHSNTLLKEIHDKGFINLIASAHKNLTSYKPFYPDVYPKKLIGKMPKDFALKAGFYAIDSFTPLTADVYKVAINSVNCALTGADLISKGSNIVYSICRPPGHHAEKKTFGGFCYFNNASIAAHALSKKGKVAFLDIDYHHGNGSQDIFYDRKDVFFISIHGHPIQAYPYYSGYEEEIGVGEGQGFNKNFPLYPGVNNASYIKTLDKAIKLFAAFKPKYLVISFGLDIMKGDPTGTFMINHVGMKSIGERLGLLSLPTLIVQEGGYSLNNLRSGAKSFLHGISSSMKTY